jgi:hypothetical protein
MNNFSKACSGLRLTPDDVTKLTIFGRHRYYNKHTKTLKQNMSCNALKIVDGLLDGKISNDENVEFLIKHLTNTYK